jgi:hypothetical protein
VQGVKDGLFYVPLLFVPLEEAILRNSNRATLKRISELHWEFLLECWDGNLSIWVEDINPIVRLASFFSFPYIRHIHGEKCAKSFVRFIKLPLVNPARQTTWKRCETEYCAQKGRTALERCLQ